MSTRSSSAAIALEDPAPTPSTAPLSPSAPAPAPAPCVEEAHHASSLTVVVPIEDGAVEALREVLESVDREIKARDLDALRKALKDIDLSIETNDATAPYAVGDPVYRINGTDVDTLRKVLAGVPYRTTTEHVDLGALREDIESIDTITAADRNALRKVLARLPYEIKRLDCEALRKAAEGKYDEITLEDSDELRKVLETCLPCGIPDDDAKAIGAILDGDGSLTPRLADKLSKVLSGITCPIAAQPGAGGQDAHAQLTNVVGLHVARWVLLPSRVRETGAGTAPSLVMWTVFDGSESLHVTQLVESARELLDRIYKGCAGYKTESSNDDVKRFLLQHKARGRVAEFDGTPGRTVEDIDKQAALARELAACVRTKKDTMRGIANKHVFLEVQQFVDGDLRKRNPALARFARTRLTLRRQPWWVIDAIKEVYRTAQATRMRSKVVMLTALGAALWLGWHFGITLCERLALTPLARIVAVSTLVVLTPLALITLLGVLLLVLVWRAEARDELHWVPVPDKEFEKYSHYLKARDHEFPGMMNRMTILTDVKPGYLRRIMLHVVLGVISFRARRNLQGALQGIESIHFAQWRLVDGGKRLLFMSNYDGPALSYLEEFSENAADGINAIWSNTRGFPPTQNVIGDGARNLEPFQNAVRAHQIPTDVWYSGYSDPARRHTMQLLNENWRIHDLLNANPTPPQIDEWIGLLEAR